MSPSSARQSANAANAQFSTGPRTPDGKARSAQNARKHGLTTKDLLIGPEDREEFDELLAGLQADVAPQGTLQQTLFDELVSSAWNLRRVRRLQTELCAHAATYQEVLTDELQSKLDRLARYKARIERTFHRSLNQLKALQTNAAIQLTLSQPVENALPLASAIEIAKRTQSRGAARPRPTPPDPVDLVWCTPKAAATADSPAGELEKEVTATAAVA